MPERVFFPGEVEERQSNDLESSTANKDYEKMHFMLIAIKITILIIEAFILIIEIYMTN